MAEVDMLDHIRSIERRLENPGSQDNFSDTTTPGSAQVMTNNRLGNDLDLQLKNRQTGGVDERDAYRQTVVASPVLPDSVRQHIIQRRNFRIEDQFEEDGDGGVD